MNLSEKIKSFNKNDLHKIKNLLLKNNNQIISLGSSCFTKRFIDFLGIKQETHFFDYLGTKGWSIHQLLQNDFKDLFDKNDYVNLRILSKGDEYTITNKKYYINFKHDFPQTFKEITHPIHISQYQNVFSKYERRVNRFKNLINNIENKILFIRIEQRSDRVIRDEDSEKNNLGELYFCKEFMKLFKEKNKNIFLLFFYSHIDKDTYFPDENLIVLKLDTPIEVYETCHIDLFYVFLQKYDFLQNIFQ